MKGFKPPHNSGTPTEKAADRCDREKDNGSKFADPSTTRKRRLVARMCQLMGEQVFGGLMPSVIPPHLPADDRMAGLAPRLRQTLVRLLAGDSEKQIAAHLGLSRHTVHVYVKGLYRHFNVNSRGELLAKFVTGAHAGQAVAAPGFAHDSPV